MKVQAEVPEREGSQALEHYFKRGTLLRNEQHCLAAGHVFGDQVAMV